VRVTEVPDPESAELVYGRMRWNTPLSEDHADLLLAHMNITQGDHILDLGCGWGELLLRAVAGISETNGTGVDHDTWALERGRDLARQRGLSERAVFLEMDISMWRGSTPRVLCIGASHGWGGSAKALQALRRAVSPGGRLLFGDGCWEHPPRRPGAAAMFGNEVLNLDDLIEQAIGAGWRVLHLSTADQREWDDFESTWREGRQEWLLSHPDIERASLVRHKVDAQLRDYVGIYRGELGFAYLVLGA